MAEVKPQAMAVLAELVVRLAAELVVAVVLRMPPEVTAE